MNYLTLIDSYILMNDSINHIITIPFYLMHIPYFNILENYMFHNKPELVEY